MSGIFRCGTATAHREQSAQLTSCRDRDRKKFANLDFAAGHWSRLAELSICPFPASNQFAVLAPPHPKAVQLAVEEIAFEHIV